MDATEHVFFEMLRKDARSGFEKYTPRLVRCLELLSEKEIWWRPNSASNAAGNIVLHLCGNVRQWLISGLGGARDVRVRDQEFSERGPLPRRALIRQFKTTVKEACEVIDRLSAGTMSREVRIQGYRVSGLVALIHVYEHFAYHAGQIIFLAKLKTGKDLRFTRLPAEKPPVRRRKIEHP